MALCPLSHRQPRRRRRTARRNLLLSWVAAAAVLALAAGATVRAQPQSSSSSQPASSSSSSSTTVATKGTVRIKHLDYLDAAALRYYLSFSSSLSESKSSYEASTSEPLPSYDVAVLFYAQWCKNCHALAPVWDQISRILKAGTADSKLIVGLFDCEANEEHMDLCNEARIKHYPTIAYISLAGAGHRLSSSSRPYPHLIHYTANNWQVGEALMDWIRTLSALSQWHRAGWGHWIRSTLSPLGLVSSSQPKSSTALSALPVGAPKAMADTMELQNLRLDYNETLAVSIRSSAFVDALLFPILSPSDKALAATTNKNASTVPSTTLVSEGGKNYTDVYAMLHQTKAWQDSINSNNNNIMNYNTVMNQIIRTCVSEVSLDYCTRLSAQYMEAWVDSFLLQPHTKTLTNAMFDEFQVQLHEDLLVVEPFCAIMDNCTLVNFAAPQCQPETCPFADPVACRYLSACLTPQLQHEYSEALDLFPHQQQQYQTQQAPKSTTDSKKEPVKKGRGGSTWGL